MKTCKHCQKQIDLEGSKFSNHVRWCVDNPKRSEYKMGGNPEAIARMNAARLSSGRTNQYTVAKMDNKPIPVSPLKGLATEGRPHTDEAKAKIKKAALASNHRRLKKGCVEYKGVLLDSSWELALAKRLDELNIEWVRPEPLKWVDKTGVEHNYFPDFYLPKYKRFIDPKNPHACRVQKEKLSVILNQYDITILKTINECKTFTI